MPTVLASPAAARAATATQDVSTESLSRGGRGMHALAITPHSRTLPRPSHRLFTPVDAPVNDYEPRDRVRRERKLVSGRESPTKSSRAQEFKFWRLRHTFADLCGRPSGRSVARTSAACARTYRRRQQRFQALKIRAARVTLHYQESATSPSVPLVAPPSRIP